MKTNGENVMKERDEKMKTINKTCPPHTQIPLTKSACHTLPPLSLCHRKLSVPQVPSNFCLERTPGETVFEMKDTDFFYKQRVTRYILGGWVAKPIKQSVILVFDSLPLAIRAFSEAVADYKVKYSLYLIHDSIEYRFLTRAQVNIPGALKGFRGEVIWMD